MHGQARLFVATGTPVQPHSSDGLDGLEVEYRWVHVPNELFEHVGFAENADTPDGFCFQFGLPVPDEDMGAKPARRLSITSAVCLVYAVTIHHLYTIYMFG